MVYLIPLVCFGVGIAVGVALMVRRQLAGLLVLLGLLVAFGIWLLMEGRAATGFDGIGYAIGLILFTMPAALGLILGGIGGHVRRRRKDRADHDDPA